jgi:general secretion pathway protein G
MRKRTDGFTLVELLIVVIILGILAAVVIPQFTSSTADAQVANLTQNLQAMRSATELYKAQHNNVYPGYPVGGGTPTAALLKDQMLKASKKDGSTAAPGTTGYGFGPYLKSDLPKNPFNDLNTVMIIADGTAMPTAGDDSTGWVFKPQTGEFRCNSAGNAPDGSRLFDL